MRPQVLLAAMAILVVLAAALPFAQSQAAAPSATLCCNKCGSCTRSFPPQCTCRDASPSGCNPACKTCEKTTVAGVDSFQCKDRVTNFCKESCTKTA